MRETSDGTANSRFSPTVFVLGNETEGVSAGVESLAQQGVAIPMANGVESLNVAVTGALIAYSAALAGGGSPGST